MTSLQYIFISMLIFCPLRCLRAAHQPESGRGSMVGGDSNEATKVTSFFTLSENVTVGVEGEGRGVSLRV